MKKKALIAKAAPIMISGADDSAAMFLEMA